MSPAAVCKSVCKSVCLQDKEEGLCLQLLSASLSAYRTRRKDYASSCCLQVCLLTGQGGRTIPPAAVCKTVCLQDKEKGLCPPAAVR